MELAALCSLCNNKYSRQSRKPKIHRCGHTICEQCEKRFRECPQCKKSLDQKSSVINQEVLKIACNYQMEETQIKNIKVSTVGNHAAGKTSLLAAFRGQQLSLGIQSTVGGYLCFNINQIVNEREVQLEFWDTAGQERFRSLARMFFRDAHIILLVFDVSVPSEQNGIMFWHKQVRESGWENAVVILVGAKIDLLSDGVGSLGQDEEALRKEENLDIVYTSSLNRSGIQNLKRLILQKSQKFSHLTTKKRFKKIQKEEGANKKKIQCCI